MFKSKISNHCLTKKKRKSLELMSQLNLTSRNIQTLIDMIKNPLLLVPSCGQNYLEMYNNY